MHKKLFRIKTKGNCYFALQNFENLQNRADQIIADGFHIAILIELGDSKTMAGIYATHILELIGAKVYESEFPSFESSEQNQTAVREQITEVSNKYKLYPNPANDKLTIVSSSFSSPSTVVIYNLTGNLVLQSKLIQSHSTLDISQLPQGIYLVELRGETNSQTIKFIKN